jgi:hypothetical protein
MSWGLVNKINANESKQPIKPHFMNCYTLEVKQKDIGWKNVRIFALNAFQAISMLSARGDVTEISHLQKAKGDWNEIARQHIQGLD